MDKINNKKEPFSHKFLLKDESRNHLLDDEVQLLKLNNFYKKYGKEQL